MPVRRTARSRRGSQLAPSGSQQPYGRSLDLPTQAAAASPCPSIDRSQLLGTSTTSQIPNAQVVGNPSSSRSEQFVYYSPCPAVEYEEAIVDDLDRDACSVGHVRPHAGKLELLNLDEWNKNDT
ncbi:hypothetical protein BDW02DRAFT_215100 [Decorospora gaudefroyi]|uniref:Uncharacterized protein n=1 Tax=Decorospora gaudefroyi TaxID=184978 RepID=A0A6A5JXC2_9PLEO|nr:hypothetical protein BDW02DRAFT_215100 [Decorospora gaudefroyi]